MTELDRLVSSLEAHEGFRGYVYDDATGAPIRPGSHVLGNPTIGFGWALNRLPISRPHALAHLRETAQEAVLELAHRAPWIKDLDSVRRVVLYELAYNMGVAGLLGFARMLAALRRGAYDDAARHLLDSKWATQVGRGRRDTLAARLSTGVWEG